jgi:hypothetical protein
MRRGTHRIPAGSLRLFSVFLATCVAYSSAYAGFNSIVSTLCSAALFQGEPPEYTETLGTPYEGDNPLVDPLYRGGFWTDDVLLALGEMQSLESEDATLPPSLPHPEEGGGPDGPVGGDSMSSIGGGEPGAPGDPSGGPSFPWEATGPGGGSGSAPGLVTTQTGNRLTTVPLLSCSSRGELDVSLVLYHNSRNEGLYSFGYIFGL